MPNKLNIVGRRFGKLLVISEDGRDRHGATMWHCQCDCGVTTRVRGPSLIAGTTRTCGCGVAARAAQPRTHGQSKMPLYLRWRSMLERCRNPKKTEYKNYGGRGIAVCERWRTSFQAFAEDMGSSFSTCLELDRIDNDGDYEPNNCRWTTPKIQNRNRRTNHRLTIGGVTKTIIEWAEHSGVKANTILTRVRRGWPESRFLEIANR